MGEPCRLDFMGVECSVRLLPGTLFREPRPLRAVEQGDMDARPFHAEPVEEIASIGWPQVGRPPIATEPLFNSIPRRPASRKT